MVDAEPVTPGAETGIFAAIGITAPPQVTESDLLDRIHEMGCEMGCRVDRPRLVDICATGVEVADGQSMGSALRREGGDQRFPITDLREEDGGKRGPRQDGRRSQLIARAGPRIGPP